VFARLHILQTTQEQHDLGLEMVRDQILPWLRDSSGFRGLIRLASQPEAKTLVITLWADEESLRASTEAGDRLGELTAEAAGGTRLGLEEYEVSLFDVTDA
jgi:heme-degrading monooxygenase HmoA